MGQLIRRAGAARGFAWVPVAALLFISLSQTTYASGFQQEPGVASGTMVNLGLRIPFGGGASVSNRSTLALRFGSAWRDVPGSVAPSGYRFVPALEAGFTLHGDPVFKLGTFDIADDLNGESTDGERRFYCQEHAAVCIIGAGLVLGGVVWAVNAANRGDNGPCIDGNGCD